MKTVFITFRYLLAIGFIAGCISCVHENGPAPVSISSTAGIPIVLSAEQQSGLPENSSSSLYVFSRPKNTTVAYKLETSVTPLTTDAKLKFSNSDLNENDYRFLFVAGYPATQSMTVKAESAESPASGTAWEQIRLVPNSELLSIDNYYQVKDISGTALLSTDSIHGELTRIVGQTVFDFSKIGNSLDDPQDIDISAVTSVFDRIAKIDITYSGITTALAFDADGNPVPATISTEQQTQEIINSLSRFRLELPTTELDTLQGGITKGGRIKGLYLLPSNQNIHTTITFLYYDTTPTCGPQQHTHIESCYIQNTLNLQITATTAPTGLSILPDSFTVNKIGIKCNRVIDIGYGSGFTIDAEWKY